MTMHNNTVSKAEQAYLQREGLLAAPSETWVHPSGSFSLAPLAQYTEPKAKRTRVEATASGAAPDSCAYCRGPVPAYRAAASDYCSRRCSERAHDKRKRARKAEGARHGR